MQVLNIDNIRISFPAALRMARHAYMCAHGGK